MQYKLSEAYLKIFFITIKWIGQKRATSKFLLEEIKRDSYSLRDRSCPGDSEKVWHLYVTLIVLERSFLTLFSRGGGQIPQGINPKYS